MRKPAQRGTIATPPEPARKRNFMSDCRQEVPPAGQFRATVATLLTPSFTDAKPVVNAVRRQRSPTRRQAPGSAETLDRVTFRSEGFRPSGFGRLQSGRLGRR